MSGLDTTQSKALHGLELHDLVLQGHHMRLRGTPGRVFTLFGCLDSWEVGACLTFSHLAALGTQGSHSPAPLQG